MRRAERRGAEEVEEDGSPGDAGGNDETGFRRQKRHGKDVDDIGEGGKDEGVEGAATVGREAGDGDVAQAPSRGEEKRSLDRRDHSHREKKCDQRQEI